MQENNFKKQILRKPLPYITKEVLLEEVMCSALTKRTMTFFICSKETQEADTEMSKKQCNKSPFRSYIVQ